MANYCPNCGARVSVASARFCKECGAQLVTASPSGSLGFVKETRDKKSPVLALLCSAFLPGLGQVYDGSLAKGFAIFLGAFVGLFILVVPGVIFWVYGIRDAYSTANKMNAGEIPAKPTKIIHMILFIVIAAVIVAAVFALIYYMLMSVTNDLLGQQQTGIDTGDINNILKNLG